MEYFFQPFGVDRPALPKVLKCIVLHIYFAKREICYFMSSIAVNEIRLKVPQAACLKYVSKLYQSFLYTHVKFAQTIFT